MILTQWDHRIADMASAGKRFIEESNYPITFNDHNTLNTLYALFSDLNSDLIVDYVDDTLAGFAIVQRTNEFHTEYFGYLGKFYVVPEHRGKRVAIRLMQEVVDWFDSRGCVVSFSTATGGIGRDTAFTKLLEHFGYTVQSNGLMIRNTHEQIK